MKKVFSKWMVLACCLCLVSVSCNKDDNNEVPTEPEPETTLSLNVGEAIDFNAAGEMKSIVVTTNQTTWAANMVVVTDTAWCKLSQNADTLKITTLKNATGTQRAGKVKIVAGSGENIKTKEISVNQAAMKTYKLFELYAENGVKGIIYELNEEKTGGKMLSLTEKRADDFVINKDFFLFNTLAIDEEDGMVNMNTIKTKVPTWEKEYPIITWVESMNVDGVTGWYLPAINEAMKIVAVYDSVEFKKTEDGELNAALVAAGGVKMEMPILTGSKMTSYIPEGALGTSTTTMDGKFANINIVGYTIGTTLPDFSKPRKGEYLRYGYSQRPGWGDNTAYQFRAIRKF